MTQSKYCLRGCKHHDEKINACLKYGQFHDNVITDEHCEYYERMWTVICDIDGVCANNKHRLRYINGKVDWDYLLRPDLVPKDTPIKEIWHLLQVMLSNKIIIIYVTGRDVTFNTITKDWLRKHSFPNGKLICKADRYEKDYLFKERVLLWLRKRHNILFALDDLQHNIDMYESYGIQTLHVKII